MNQRFCNLLTTVKNGQLNRKQYIYIQTTNKISSFVQFLWSKGFILAYTKISPHSLKIFLKYSQNKPAINLLKIISKPSKAFVLSKNQIWNLKLNHFVIVHTTKGFKTLVECKTQNLGGQVICIIY